MLVYGFRAMHYRLEQYGAVLPSDLVRLQKSDWDILISLDEFNSLLASIPKSDVISIRPIKGARYFIKTIKGNYDIHIILPDNDSSNARLYKLGCTLETIIDPYRNVYSVPTLVTLRDIKESHRFIREGFFKTMNDYYRLQSLVTSEKMLGRYFYTMRLSETLDRAKRKTRHINLNQGKEDFFTTKGVTYIYDHDSIHRAIALTAEPMYLRYLKDGQDVICDENKWDDLQDLHKLYAVLEESYVIALERFLTKGSSKTPYEAFMVALEKVCTTLCKGWFREFAYENYLTILGMYSGDFVDKFEEAKKRGEILPYKESK